MSLTTRKDQAQANLDRARVAAAQARVAAAQATALAKNASASAAQGVQGARDWAAPWLAQGVYQAREWAAPRIDQAGHTVQETVAPKVSELLTSTAQRVDPAPPAPERRSWPRLIAVLAVLAAAGGAVAAIMRGRNARTPDTLMAEEEAAQASAEPDAASEEQVMADADVAGNGKRDSR